MKRQSRILAGTALGLLMASAPIGAFAFSGLTPAELNKRAANDVFTLAQAACAEGETAEACAARQQQEPKQEAPAPQPEAAPEPEPEAAPEPAPEPQAEPAPEPQAEPAPEPQAEPAPAPEAAPEPAPEPQAEPAPEPQAEPEAKGKAKPERKAKPEPQAEPAPEAAPEAEQAPAEPAPEAPAAEQPAPEAPAATQEPAPAEPAPAPEAAPAEQAPAEQPAPEAPAAEQPAAPEAPATGEPAPAAPTGEAPAQSGEAPVDPNAPPVDPNAAPILDSQKEAPPAGQQTGTEQPAQPGTEPAQPGAQTAEPAPAPVDPGPPPENDAAAQAAVQPQQVQPVAEEKGTRVERAPDEDRRRRERPEGVEVVREIGDRIIIEIDNTVIVESDDRPRMTRGAREVYYEELPRGRIRETIIRENGVQIVTIRDRYGDVIRRSRIAPDGRESVLIYVDDSNYERVRDWRDPGLDLPPMRLTIPREEYILEAEFVDDPNDYYEFLEQPPVERVERLYSVDEVKRSARVRDIARRVDLDTLTFEFGSASIPESEIPKLEGVAKAMEKLLAKNPAETFLIEGHTDAVGSDVANLALSDQRAEAVADALTNVFAIPPENLSTQGYGERYLKVKTDAQERENRRVAIRRITPLVAPVASAN
jgi:outer membrane protein OmpA-like peptidoglycan-associated protein